MTQTGHVGRTFWLPAAMGTPMRPPPKSPCFWLCTSGTTGRPKLAMHRHADVRITCEGYAREVLDVQPDDRHLSVAPMFHAYGFGNSLTFPLAAGAQAVLEPARPPTPALVAALMTRHRPTLFFAVPTFYAALVAADIPDTTFAPLRQAVSAGEALPAELFSRFRERFGVEILDGIGSTELTHIFISNRAGHAVPGASGTPVGGHAVRILDEEGHAVPVETPGQLWVSGPAAATGYWCRSDETRRTFVGEWVATGDLYSVDAGGVYRHLGRRDDMLKVGGEWVSPTEVESVLLGHRMRRGGRGRRRHRGRRFDAGSCVRGTDVRASPSTRTPCSIGAAPSLQDINGPGGSSWWRHCPRQRPARSSAPNCAARRHGSSPRPADSL